MNANEFGKRLGIGVRVAGRIAQQRTEESARKAQAAQPNGNSQAQGVVEPPSQRVPAGQASAPRIIPNAREVREIKEKSHKLTRAAGRGVGGFLRPFRRVGGILWLEVTGFFFGLFALFFAQDLWRSRLNYAAGPLHTRFLVAAVLTVIFAYLSASAFWRARRR
jgi:hypothetical protein